MKLTTLKQEEHVILDRFFTFEIYDRGEVSLVVFQTEEIINGKKSKSKKTNLIFRSEYVKQHINDEDKKSWSIFAPDNEMLGVVTEHYLGIYKNGTYKWAGEDFFEPKDIFHLTPEIFETIPLERFVEDNDYRDLNSIFIGIDRKPIHRKVWVGYIAAMIESDQYCLNTVKEIFSLNLKISDVEVEEIPHYNRDNSHQTHGISFCYSPDQEEFEELYKVGDFTFTFDLMKKLKKGLDRAKKAT